MYMDDLFNIDKNQIIGTVHANSSGGVVLADEPVYSFLGGDSISNICSYIREDKVEEFRTYFNNCTYEQKDFVSYLKRYDGEYVMVVLIMSLHKIHDKEYVKINIYDVITLAEKYDLLNDYAHKLSYYMQMSGKYFVEYELSTKKLRVYRDNEDLVDCDFDYYIEGLVKNQYIAEDSLSNFYHCCEDIKSGHSSFYYKLNVAKDFTNVKANSVIAINGNAVEINNSIRHVICTVSVVESDESYYDIIRQKVNLDALTGLLNKTAIKSYAIDKIVSGKCKTLTLAILDLDNFKMVNDTYGHMFGDDTLVTVATVLKSIVGNRGAVGRIGGDEFLIVLEDFEDPKISIKPLLKAIRNHVEWSFKNVVDDAKITCSIGISVYPQDANNYDDLFKIADRCLYIAKNKGRDRYIIYIPEMHGSVEEILSVSNSINITEFISETDKHKHLLSAIDRLNNAETYIEGQNVVRKILLEMLYYYVVDRIGFYPFDDSDGIIQVCSYDIQNADAPVKLYDEFEDDFKNDLVTIGNNQNIKNEFPKLFKYLSDNDILSVAMYRIWSKNDDTKPRGLFVISTYNRYQKWAATDIKLISTLFKLMSKYV